MSAVSASPASLGLVDRRAHRLRRRRIVVDQRGEMILGLVDVGRIGRQLALRSHHLRRAERRAAKLHGALGDRVDMLVEVLAEPVEHLVNGDEVRALDVPMRLLGDQREVDGVGEAGVEELDRGFLDVRLQIVARGVRRHDLFAPLKLGWAAGRGGRFDSLRNLGRSPLRAIGVRQFRDVAGRVWVPQFVAGYLPARISLISRWQRSAMKSSSSRTLGSCSFLCG